MISYNQGLYYWPKQADGSKRAPSTATPCCPIVYFLAENSSYTIDGTLPVQGTDIDATGNATYGTTKIKSQSGHVWPCLDMRLSNLRSCSLTWMNPSSFQILCCGLDLKYGSNNA